jgi:hypothetical protein
MHTRTLITCRPGRSGLMVFSMQALSRGSLELMKTQWPSARILAPRLHLAQVNGKDQCHGQCMRGHMEKEAEPFRKLNERQWPRG